MTVRKILIVALALGMLSAPLAADAEQPARIFRIGYLNSGVISGNPLLDAFRQGLRALGYVEGQNIRIELRSAEGESGRLPDLAAELVRLKVDIIVTQGTAAGLAAKKATGTIPIVMGGAGDPVESGLVASLARPGGNITGLSTLSPELSAKRLELLKEAVSQVSPVAVLMNPGNPVHAIALRETQVAAQTLGVKLLSWKVRGPDELENVFAAMTRGGARALIVVLDPMFSSYRGQIVGLAVKHRLPAMYGERYYVDAGGLMSYSPSLPDINRRAATYVDKILKGAKPADLPVEQPTKFDLVINLKTAKALGLTIPQSVLIRADQVIQ